MLVKSSHRLRPIGKENVSVKIKSSFDALNFKTISQVVRASSYRINSLLGLV